MTFPQALAAVALASSSFGPVRAQALTSDCAFDGLEGSVATVETSRARFAAQVGGNVLGATVLRGHDEFDEACNYTSRVLYDNSETHWLYWPDEQGRGQRLRTWSVACSDAPPPPPPAPPPASAGSAGSDDDRGTRIETLIAADSTRIFERELTNGILQKDWTHTLNGEGRVVNSLMLDGSGEPRYHIVNAYEGAETVITYEWLRTSQYSGSPLRREKTVDEETDSTGNWTRRMVYEWNEPSMEWRPKDLLTRSISYR